MRIPAVLSQALEQLPARDLDLAATLNCGQVFHWRKQGAGYVGTISDQPVYLEQQGECLLVTRGCSAMAHQYLALDHPLGEIYASFPDDPAMRAALAACRGLRIIRQPLWECLATFITSALKQVAHIAQISHCLRQRFGLQAGESCGVPIYAYPSVEAIAAVQEEDLRVCGLGFRAVSLLKTAQKLAASPPGGAGLLESWRALPRTEAQLALTDFRGVGTKVANCVLLFGYAHLDAFPIDVWIERVLRERYFKKQPNLPLPELQAFADKYFGPYRGYAQQYLFHHARVTQGRAGRSPALADEVTLQRPARRLKSERQVRGRE